eukprot:CAMPEP_0183357662 /NCGR_PEP_ID=MMETSP0164_2-20130417/46963_1 /TAXON_ID=221442 /ORGANISM="Coccolithus pelagicus ssp braarudi, Strain PLY182g" /LENGTH=337 /DNA_ID=CAMNT_0025531339 /DNA_START=30 /DNA_END=1040 /DNA_ORIENTATION=-
MSVGGLLASADFWEKESGAPLLRRNAGFLLADEPLSAELQERVARWPALCGADSSDGTVVPEGGCEDEAALRIFLRDAERTFSDGGHQTRMIDLLKRVWPENKDYHQGLGYTASLLMLLFDEDAAVSILLELTRNERFTPGYWKAAPDAYVRDAMVYTRLIEERHPQVHALLASACLVPEAYASKWFIGLCVHVLPFAALFDFVEAFLEEGYLFLFKFSIAIVAATSEHLLQYKSTDVNKILEVLRLDIGLYPDDYEGGAFFTRLVAEAKATKLEKEQVDTLRVEEGEKLAEKMRKTREREAQLAAEESDDEIVFSDEEDDESKGRPHARVATGTGG